MRTHLRRFALAVLIGVAALLPASANAYVSFPDGPTFSAQWNCSVQGTVAAQWRFSPFWADGWYRQYVYDYNAGQWIVSEWIENTGAAGFGPVNAGRHGWFYVQYYVARQINGVWYTGWTGADVNQDGQWNQYYCHF